MSDKIVTADHAYQEGREARGNKSPRTRVPKGYRETPGLRAQWLRGWDEAAPRAQEPEVETREPEVTTPLDVWPDGRPFPEFYRRPQVHPCPGCRHVYLKRGQQAVVVESLHNGVAYMWCRGCQHRFKLPER